MEDWITAGIQRQALPKPLREETAEEFCAKYGIPTSTFYYTMHKPENQKRILELVLNKAKDSAPEILDILVEKAKKGEDRSMELYLDNIMKLAKNLDVQSGGKPIPILGYVHKDESPGEDKSFE